MVQVADDQPVPQVRLSRLERSILRLLIRCYSTKQIADMLGIRPQTVSNYLSTLSIELGATGRALSARAGRRRSSCHAACRGLPVLG
jgi:DNA-binding CsgD family transcriptional regulator